VALKVSSTLTNAAIWKSRHMAYYQYMQHNDPAPPVARTWFDRIVACNYPTSNASVGENIAYGYSTPSAVMNGWMNSSGHRANILNSSFRVIGVSAAATSNGTLYWTQDFGSYDDSGSSTSPPPPPPPSPPPPPPPSTTTTAYPGSVTIFTGSVRAGGASQLAAADGSALQINSASGRTSWYGRINNVPNSLKSLSVTYKGWNSLTCSQTLSLWNWTYGSWFQLDSRSVGSTSTTITASASGTLANYVSGSTGNGDVAVRVNCTRSDYLSFYASGDLMKIVFGN
jgi:hypothetical protein